MYYFDISGFDDVSWQRSRKSGKFMSTMFQISAQGENIVATQYRRQYGVHSAHLNTSTIDR
jgi:hypothetical protein